MSSFVRPTKATFDDDSMWVTLSDGRVLEVLLAWFPRLLHAMPEQRRACRITSRGLHWDPSDEDVSVAGLLAGYGDQAHKSPAANE